MAMARQPLSLPAAETACPQCTRLEKDSGSLSVEKALGWESGDLSSNPHTAAASPNLESPSATGGPWTKRCLEVSSSFNSTGLVFTLNELVLKMLLRYQSSS